MAVITEADIHYQVEYIHADGERTPVFPDRPSLVRQKMHPVDSSPYMADMTYGLGNTTIALFNTAGKQSEGAEEGIIVGDGGSGSNSGAFLQVREGGGGKETHISFDTKYFRPARRRSTVVLSMIDHVMRRASLAGDNDFIEFELVGGSGELPKDITGVVVKRAPLHSVEVAQS